MLFVVASGLTLVFGMMGIINFAHASFYMLGAYFAYALGGRLGFLGAMLVAPLLVAIVGIAVERFLLRPVHKFGHGHELLMTFGISYVAQELIKLIFGNYPVSYGVPEFLRFPAFSLFGTDYPAYRVFVAMTAFALFALLVVLLRFTRLGIVVRAAVQRPAITGVLGHNIDAVFAGSFGVGAWMAGVAGVVGGALLSTSPNMALEMSTIVFVIVVVGGLGSLEGAFFASLLIGLLTSFAVGLNFSLADIGALVGLRGIGELGGLIGIKLSTFAASMPVLLMLLVLVMRPTGLFGSRF